MCFNLLLAKIMITITIIIIIIIIIIRRDYKINWFGDHLDVEIKGMCGIIYKTDAEELVWLKYFFLYERIYIVFIGLENTSILI